MDDFLEEFSKLCCCCCVSGYVSRKFAYMAWKSDHFTAQHQADRPITRGVWEEEAHNVRTAEFPSEDLPNEAVLCVRGLGHFKLSLQQNNYLAKLWNLCACKHFQGQSIAWFQWPILFATLGALDWPYDDAAWPYLRVKHVMGDLWGQFHSFNYIFQPSLLVPKLEKPCFCTGVPQNYWRVKYLYDAHPFPVKPLGRLQCWRLIAGTKPENGTYYFRYC